MPLRDSVILFKEEGVYRLTGNSVTDFDIQPYDLTTFLAAPETAVAMSDNVLFLSTKGPLGIGESAGVFPLAPAGLDCPIKETLLALLATAPTTTTKAFGVAYESEKQFYAWVPTADADSVSTWS